MRVFCSNKSVFANRSYFETARVNRNHVTVGDRRRNVANRPFCRLKSLRQGSYAVNQRPFHLRERTFAQIFALDVKESKDVIESSDTHRKQRSERSSECPASAAFINNKCLH